jgi:hypothetical protein
MILLLDAMQTGDLSRIWRVEKVNAVFVELDKLRVHKLARLAVERISWALNELRRMQADTGHRDRRRDGRGGEALDSEMQGAARSEATTMSDTVHDTVMGNTGMLLLEDPGLQSYVREAFSPLAWGLTEIKLDRVSPLRQMQPNGNQQAGTWYGEGSIPPDHANLNVRQGPCDAVHDLEIRSSGQLQRLQGSAPGSAPLRYATLATAPPGAHVQPQGLTSPEPTHESCPTSIPQQHQQSCLPSSTPDTLQVGPSPPHLRHHSYPALRHHVPSPLVPHPPHASTHADLDFNDPNATLQGLQPTANSTSLATASSHALSQTLSDSPSFPFASYVHKTETGNANVHTDIGWAEPAYPVTSSTPASARDMGLPHAREPSQGMLGLTPQAGAQQTSTAHHSTAFPFRFSTAGHKDRSETTATIGIHDEQMEGAEAWRRWGTG